MSSKPTEVTAKRASFLWRKMLENPKYDNLGPNSNEPPESRRINKTASMLAATLPSNATSEILDKFEDELTRRLLDDSGGGYGRTLATDYGPDRILGEVAEAVGLKMEFPWKTVMWIDENSVSVSYGYGAESVYHYPLGDGRWLITTLTGSDISEIISYVKDGILPSFVVEEQERTTPTNNTTDSP